MKKCAHASDSKGKSDGPAVQHGHPSDAGNYSKEDTKFLLNCIQEELPVGPKGWVALAARFKKWAHKNRHPEHGQKSLETKYKQFLKTKKLTGDAACPPEIKWAHQIKELINQHAGTRDLNDSDFDDDAARGVSSDEAEVAERHPVCITVACHVPTPPLLCNSRINGLNVINQLSCAFDPNIQRQQDDKRSQCSLHNTQLLGLTQQLCDTQATIKSLHNQMAIMQGHSNNVEQARDRAEPHLELREGEHGGVLWWRLLGVHKSCEKIY
ncbi:hypothetical protein C8J57DRAFT_1100439 [Mycena rebaudengoi]|nr:hypothetical protein C8J57DRAFT_1100439 [Mycena rebaudengoi]